MKIAIIGSPDTILGFKAVGIEPYSINSIEQGREVISALRKSDKYGIVLVTEDWAEKLDQELILLEEKTLPAVIRIPASSGATGKGLKSLKRIVERAVGSDILG
jgi:V/A-type H+-transporting ATPase subunit F